MLLASKIVIKEEGYWFLAITVGAQSKVIKKTYIKPKIYLFQTKANNKKTTYIFFAAVEKKVCI